MTTHIEWKKHIQSLSTNRKVKHDISLNIPTYPHFFLYLYFGISISYHYHHLIPLLFCIFSFTQLLVSNSSIFTLLTFEFLLIFIFTFIILCFVFYFVILSTGASSPLFNLCFLTITYLFCFCCRCSMNLDSRQNSALSIFFFLTTQMI